MHEIIPEDKREYIINELMETGFIVHKRNEIVLLETEESGASELKIHLNSDDNLWIENADRQITNLLFFKKAKQNLYTKE